MTYKISKKIAIPDPVYAKLKFPFSKLKVGESFSVGHVDQDKLRAAAGYYSRTRRAKLTTRRTATGRRVWRVK